jgi:hypothetical protein
MAAPDEDDEERVRRIVDSAEALKSELRERRDPTLTRRRASPDEALEHAERIRPVTPGIARLRLIYRPASGPHRSLTLLHRVLDVTDPFHVREAIWFRGSREVEAYGELREPGSKYIPSDDLVVRDARLLGDSARALLYRLECMQLPLAFEEIPAGDQDDSYEVFVERGHAQVRLRWPGSGPAEWAALHEWALDLRALAEHTLEVAGLAAPR